MLISENVKLDNQSKFEGALGKYMKCCSDEKFITSRQAIQGLANVVKTTGKYNERIELCFRNFQLSKYKEN